jgi:hypothetical protein
LIQKIQCHEAASMTAPPTSGPRATAIPLIPDQTPSAIPRRSGGNASASRVSVSGVTIAPPIPWIARAETSRPVLGASAAAPEATVKSVIPPMNVRLRPILSPSAAPVRSSTAYERTYALTVHSSDWTDAPSSRWMLGSATLTTRLSSTTMNSPIETIVRVQARLRDVGMSAPSYLVSTN